MIFDAFMVQISVLLNAFSCASLVNGFIRSAHTVFNYLCEIGDTPLHPKHILYAHATFSLITPWRHTRFHAKLLTLCSMRATGYDVTLYGFTVIRMQETGYDVSL